MDKRIMKRLVEHAAILKGMAHPLRLFVVEELAGGEKCVSDLATEADAKLNALSWHLRRLKDAGVIQEHRERKSILYSLTDGALRSLNAFRASMESVLVGKTRKLKKLCRTEDDSVIRERRRRSR